MSGGDYFAEDVRRQLVDKFGADVATQGGLVVRTSLDPVLQAAADKALRAGLMRYDQRRGGWRGPVTRLTPAPPLHGDWATQLAAVARPPGMLSDWRLAVVLEAGDAEAKLGVFGAGEPPHVLPMQLADIAWARPAQNGSLGATPKRVTDVVHPGDVVMVEHAAAEAASGRTAARPERLLLRQIPQVEGALVSLDPATGRVLALCGGWSFDMSQFDRATQANRQPGSSFKPFVYLTALEQGISPSQRFLDAPFVVDLGAQGKWRPGNYEGDFLGPVSLHVALERRATSSPCGSPTGSAWRRWARPRSPSTWWTACRSVLPAALGAVETTVLREAGRLCRARRGRQGGGADADRHACRIATGTWSGTPSEMRCDACDDPSKPPELTDNRPQVADPASVFQIVNR